MARPRNPNQHDPDAPLPTPFTVVIDSREQANYTFQGLRADAKQLCRPLVVQTVVRGLRSGDYSLAGHENAIAIERKSLSDLYGTLGKGRDRFERELARLAEMRLAVVMVEASWHEILTSPPDRSRLNPKTVHRSVIAWQQRFPNVHWWTAGDRRLAEITTFRILERWWRDQ
jgi:DNA excision repair protein ERCC-4